MSVSEVTPPTKIQDVAGRAGVSPSTVSRVLRGATNVLPETRDRVVRAAADLGYSPSPAASRLASGRTRTVAVIVPFVTRWFFSEVLRGVERVLREAEYDVLLYVIGDEVSRQRFFGMMPLRRRVDAVLAVASVFSQHELDRLQSLGVPIMSIGGTLAGASRVGINDQDGAVMAVRHLIVLGHRDIVMISGDPGDPISRMTTLGRQAGFKLALREANIPDDPDRIVCEPWGVGGGARAMERLLGRARLPTGVFAESDEMAFGALQTLRKAGMAVPATVSIIGFDDHEMATPSELTTVAQPVVTQGELAGRTLLAALGDPHCPITDTELPVRLVVRGTTGPPPPDARATIGGLERAPGAS